MLKQRLAIVVSATVCFVVRQNLFSFVFRLLLALLNFKADEADTAAP